MTRVKICGLRDAETAAAAVTAGADMIGLMFAESRRQVTPEECHGIIEALRSRREQAGAVRFDGPAPGEVSPRTWFNAWSESLEDAMAQARPLVVGVFAGQPVEDVNAIADAAALDLVQLSGGESPDFVERVHRPVILVRHVEAGADADDITSEIRPGPVAIMLDTAHPAARGGTGRAFDWEIGARIGERLPVLLAGGLTPENVAEAIAIAGPWAVDVSSGVETDGRKDIDKIRAFIRAAKGTQR